jgi:hypothetical protein
MRLKCPHCRTIGEYDRSSIGVFVACQGCGRDFRPAASMPVISSDLARTVIRAKGVFEAPEASEEAHWEECTRRGMNYFRLRMYDKAAEEFRKSIKINRDQPAVLRVLGRIRSMAEASS